MAAGRSDVRPERLAGEDENLTIWSDTETALFLKIWRRPDVQTALRQYTRKRPIWKKVSSELAAEGYRRSAEQCKSKMHNLMTSYRRVKKGVDPESRCKFFAVIDQVMMSPEFDLQAAGSTGADGMDMDGGSSEESGPSTSALSDSAAMYPHSHSVSPGGRDDASAAAELDRGRPGPWRPVPVRLSEQPVYPGPGPGQGQGQGRPPRDDDSEQPPRKRYCNWEERYEAEVAARGGRADDDPSGEMKRADLPMMTPMGGPTSCERPPRPESPEPHEDSSGARDLRVPSRSPPERRGTIMEEPPRGYSTMEARDLITARARQLLSVLPGHPALHPEGMDRDDGPQTNGQHRPDEEAVRQLQDDRTANSLERMETLLQELVDMQRAFLLSEERRRREQLIREENWRIQDKEFLVRLAQTLANSHH